MDAFIEVLLHRLLATSVQTALLTAVVWALCRLLPRLAPATQCWLWWLVALQASLGLFARPIELPWLPPAPPAIPEVGSAAQWSLGAGDSIATPPAATEYAGPWWPVIAVALWMTGLLTMAWITLHKWWNSRRLLQQAVPCTDVQLLRMLARTALAGRPGRLPQLWYSQCIRSPLLIGQLNPVLLLPAATSLSSEELEMAIAHELAHLRRGDLWWGWVPALARLLFFFHPLVHVAVREYGIAREAACDAAVVDAGHRSRRDYGRLLLRLGTTARTGTALAAASPTFNVLKRRLNMLQHTSFLSRSVSIALLVVVIAIGVMPLRLVAAAASTPPPVRQPEPVATQATATGPAAAPAPAPAKSPPQEVVIVQEVDQATPGTTDGQVPRLGQRFDDGTRMSDDEFARRFLDHQAQLLEKRLAEAQTVYSPAHPEVVVLRRQLEALRAQFEEARARIGQPRAFTGDAASRTLLPAEDGSSQAMWAMQMQLAESPANRRLQPASRPAYEAAFTQFTAECRASAERSPSTAANAPLQRAECLEQAELRAYYAALAAEKEALVEQRRRATLGLPSDSTTTR